MREVVRTVQSPGFSEGSTAAAPMRDDPAHVCKRRRQRPGYGRVCVGGGTTAERGKGGGRAIQSLRGPIDQ